MARNNQTGYRSQAPGFYLQDTGGYGFITGNSTDYFSGYLFSGPYHIGEFFVDTGVDAPAGTGDLAGSVSDMYLARAWATDVTFYNHTGATYDGKVADILISADPVTRRSFTTSAPLTPNDRVYLHCRARIMNAFMAAGSTAYPVSVRVNKIKWGMWRV